MDVSTGQRHGALHLDDAVAARLLAGEPALVAHFREHLAGECEACETFLATSPLLDGATDRLLLALAPAPATAPPLDQVGLKRLQRRMGLPSPARRWVAAAGAMAAVAALALVAVRLGHTGKPGAQLDGTAGGWDGVKGAAGSTAVELQAVARGPDGSLRRVEPGAQASTRDVLALRYHASEAGEGLLFSQSAGGRVELLGRFRLDAGTHDLEGEAGLTGVSLEGETGTLSLWLVALPPGGRGGADVDVAAVREALASGRARETLGLSVARFDVRVQPGQDRP